MNVNSAYSQLPPIFQACIEDDQKKLDEMLAQNDPGIYALVPARFSHLETGRVSQDATLLFVALKMRNSVFAAELIEKGVVAYPAVTPQSLKVYAKADKRVHRSKEEAENSHPYGAFLERHKLEFHAIPQPPLETQMNALHLEEGAAPQFIAPLETQIEGLPHFEEGAQPPSFGLPQIPFSPRV